MLSVLRLNRSLIYELTKREFSGRYRGSFGGVIWSFAQPLFLLCVYTIAFGLILKTRWGYSGGTADYAFILFSGLIVFNLFSDCLAKSVHLITANPNFVKKIVFPLELLPLVSTLGAVMHSVIAILIWIAGYTIVYGVPHASVLFAPLVLACFFPVLLGIGWLLSAAAVIVRDIGQLTGMISHTLLFLTPIFYSVETAPPPIQNLLVANPLTFVVNQFRAVLFYGSLPDFLGLALYFVGASIFAWLSSLAFAKLRPVFADLV
ncbi:lipopolysaccharide transport system permease protein [Rhizobium tibeticum]|uniref:Transport permease protein n=1 Tax=Rhizobium tibeticum TaxID=501024 RepID=A0A1H8NTJ4_9HYPH|nr:ABC transporter permease [Rhizobium tibeticum]SEI00451.1 Teichoic acid translocation permease protein TagG [Rhizobium tibeticum]SEO32872.1 lipopolysaccharide transport system permease protein [Rhizobium tibeticum]